LGLVLAAVAVGRRAAPLAAVVVATIIAVRWLSMRKIGGISGDVLGTCEQVAECLALVVLSGLALHHVW
ncbi:MAG: adenosylcobinamide-GDP ribazoletransferase, partial [Ilumatobacteraceae bacterium]